ncbi:hypothetical protein [Nitrospirillum iridis]|uniref:Uncharacterized protein n=1 Tax=Nitrospirillum iridis TaxID=765888 RepID=A0A7X0EEN5_9PROT|nr:hypothetical protein [Nitrospirillum iridis]MBB6253215.1 hypothetical protein [Nitrospirillum iridis]
MARFAHDASGRKVERLASGVHQIQAFAPQGHLVRGKAAPGRRRSDLRPHLWI